MPADGVDIPRKAELPTRIEHTSHRRGPLLTCDREEAVMADAMAWAATLGTCAFILFMVYGGVLP